MDQNPKHFKDQNIFLFKFWHAARLHLYKIICYLDDAFIQSNLQLIRINRGQSPWSNVGLRALLKDPTAVQILPWLHWASNHQPSGSQSCTLAPGGIVFCLVYSAVSHLGKKRQLNVMILLLLPVSPLTFLLQHSLPCPGEVMSHNTLNFKFKLYCPEGNWVYSKDKNKTQEHITRHIKGQG